MSVERECTDGKIPEILEHPGSQLSVGINIVNLLIINLTARLAEWNIMMIPERPNGLITLFSTGKKNCWRAVSWGNKLNCESTLSYYCMCHRCMFQCLFPLLHANYKLIKAHWKRTEWSLVVRSWLHMLPIWLFNMIYYTSKYWNQPSAKLSPLTHLHMWNGRWLAIECCANGVTNDLSLALHY